MAHDRVSNSQEIKQKKKIKIKKLRAKFEIQQLHTMCLYVLENFLPNPLTESALNRSCSVILLTGIVPSGQDSPDKLHN